MNEERIVRVADNYEKRDTYAKMFSRYKVAMRNEFYLEAIFIAYAVIEDRITRFLFHAGLINDKGKPKLSKGKAKDLARQLSEGKTAWQISCRLLMMKNLSKWAEETERCNLESKYEIALLDKMIGSVDLSELNAVLERIPKWINGRNECVHALMRKNVESAEDRIKELAEESYDIIRTLDSIEKKFKKNNNIRRRFNIQ